jgi:hypothetical protein
VSARQIAVVSPSNTGRDQHPAWTHDSVAGGIRMIRHQIEFQVVALSAAIEVRAAVIH